MTVQELVAKYIEIRDKKEAFSRQYKDKVAAYDAALGKMEAVLMKTLDSSGMESVKTDKGTVFLSSRSSATVADRDAFIDFVIRSEGWVFLENRVSKSAVEQFVAANEIPPPGVNLRIERTVNIRRPSK
jgi:hypothetical protein